MKYNDLTRRNFELASRAGVLTRGHRGSAGDRGQGTWVQFDLQVTQGTVTDARFLAFGCPHTIAVAQWLAETCRGHRLQPAMPESLAVLRDLFAVPLDKLGRLLIVEDAWKAAVIAAIDSPDTAPTS